MNILEALQLQRSMFAWHVASFDTPAYTVEQAWALNLLDITQRILQLCICNPLDPDLKFISDNVDALRSLNTALVAMPTGDWFKRSIGVTEVEQ